MPSPFSKLKTVLCIPENTESQKGDIRLRSTNQSGSLVKNDGGRQNSADSIGSGSVDETTRSKRVINVLRAFNLSNLKTVKDVALVGVEGEPIDDKTYLMERIVQLAADLPVTSRTSATLTNAFLNVLWTDLQHPPQSYLGHKFIFRNADGSGNNILWPHLGAAGQPYARTVRPRFLQPVARPDPGVIFDSILARKKFDPHPNKISSVLFYVATIIIHDIFHTSHDDYNISEVDSYLDLAPLYGSSDEQQKAVRTLENGKLKPDCFSDIRILGFPPGVGVLLIMFNRFHNRVAEDLALIDEGGRFSKILRPSGDSKNGSNPRKEYDEALFQTARLITTGLYINIIMKDYVRTILNLNRVDSAWNLDPRSEEGKAIFGHKIPEATGNSVSAEFNLVYRWHSCVSERDDQWTNEVYHKLFGEAGPANIGEFLSGLNKWAQSLSQDPLQRPFADLKRSSDGTYPDEDLSAIWTKAVSDVAGRYGASHVPTILKNVEILGIIQSRSWNLASLNEFREYFKLKPYEKFEDINPDPIVAEQLRRLYGHPDNVEIYPGVIVEAAKEAKKPGSGLCTNFTTSRAILSDAVALVRGDRFYTVDYSPANLTNYGFNRADSDPSVDYGCVMYKLVLNALPNSYRRDSIYAHYPLVVPEENKLILTGLKKAQLYDFEKPVHVAAPARVTTLGAYKLMMSNLDAFRSTWHPETFMAGRRVGWISKQSPVLASILLEADGLADITKRFYSSAIVHFIKDEAYELAGRQQVDIVHDVFNKAHVRFVAAMFHMPSDDLDLLLSAVYACCSTSRDSSHQFATCVKLQKALRRLAESLQSRVENLRTHHAGLHSHPTGDLETYLNKAIQTCAHVGMPFEQIVWEEVIPVAATVYVYLSRHFAEALDYLLRQGEGGVSQISQNKIHESVKEVMSKVSPTTFVREGVTSFSFQDGGHQIEISPRQYVICDLEQTETTPIELGGEVGLCQLLRDSAFSAALQVIAQLKGLRRADGSVGALRTLHGTDLTTYLNKEESMSFPHPLSMKVDWQEHMMAEDRELS
ncbi:hypothetical protein PV08_05982 [Exophiala spinifera]|uniref:Uncharacterized protein n=1 Tax=Exophiala spinifera TaxID=91928 RepID=A0A0D1ZT12_9EURO|nr:uncharacterized protein PV08_05982 [Exophiala spinifera]KIW15932.1 hypothetical protein PV08_05982 [Exophiala spinifera]